MSWSPATISLSIQVFACEKELKTLDLLEDFDHQDHLHREIWELKHELIATKKSLGI